MRVPIEPTIAPLTAAYNQLLSADDTFYGESGLYNALAQSDLTLDGIDIENGTAQVAFSGEIVLGGVCDRPRVETQLRQTALQYSTVDEVNITVNGQPLDDVLR